MSTQADYHAGAGGNDPEWWIILFALAMFALAFVAMKAPV